MQEYTKNDYDYVCIPRPFWDWEEENRKSDSPLDGDKLAKKYNKTYKGFRLDRKATSKPDYKWIMMRASHQSLHKGLHDVAKRNPDNFGMYVYNDFEGYGIVEVLENYLSSYSTAFNCTVGRKRPADVVEQSQKEMWMVISTLGQFLNEAAMDAFGMIDDGAKFTEIVELMARAILSALNSLDQAGYLRQDSPCKDIGFVIGTWYSALEQFEDLADLEIHQHLLGYAKKGNIDVSAVFGTVDAVESYDEDLPENPNLINGNSRNISRLSRKNMVEAELC